MIILILFASLVCRTSSDVIRSKALLVLGARCRHGSATGFGGYIYNSWKVNNTCADDVHRLPSVKDAMMIPMSSEALDEQLAEPPKSGFFVLHGSMRRKHPLSVSDCGHS